MLNEKSTATETEERGSFSMASAFQHEGYF